MLMKHRKTDAGTGPRAVLPGVYLIDPRRSTLGFSVRHGVVSSVCGTFTDLAGILKFDGARPTGFEARVSVRSGSLRTGTGRRDAHITGPDLLDADTFPLMSFRSRRAVRAGDDRFRLHGHLRIKDIELPLGIDLTLGGGAHGRNGENHVGFVGTAALRRSDWGLNWDMPRGSREVLTGDTVKLTLDVSAVALERAA
jgi:polyisoprenoid-binding protein YceI